MSATESTCESVPEEESIGKEESEASDDDSQSAGAATEATAPAEDSDEEPEFGSSDDDEGEREAETLEEVLWHGAQKPANQPHKNLWQAAWDGEVEVLKRYVKLGADINSFGLDGFGFGLFLRDGREYVVIHVWEKSGQVASATPLHFAVCANNVDMVRILLGPQFRANPMSQLKTTGATPKDIARMNGCRDIVEELDKYTGTYDVHSAGYAAVQQRTMESGKHGEMFLRKVLGANSNSSPVMDDAIRREWTRWDWEERGTITRDRLREVYDSFETFGVEESEEEIEALLDRFTGLMDNDVVCYEEFAALICHMQQR
eukprot:NODE_2424_length_1067_cov_73.947872_g2406_i0.p1 GENE.NODE_2424_length_1067_cov_73.947872_g2406_i0~~NODE_2424_length_1067_cov_73.947872_g2406_i0.p1  ORF type:complete len:317 (+),score=43.63 NODE_2424_length_1067_cov_73.947872_g2406_i0:78-1028(+)